MSDSLVPIDPPSGVPAHRPDHGTPTWPTQPAPLPQEEGIAWARYRAALLRYKWLVLATIVGGTAIGFLLAGLLTPIYEAQAKILIAAETPVAQDRQGPVRSAQLLDEDAWGELLTSSVVLDPVALQRKLYLQNASADSALFASFEPGQGFRPGAYELTVDPAAGTWVLSGKNGKVDSGALGAPIGRTVGFDWTPPAELLRTRRTVEFSVTTPRGAAQSLRQRLDVTLPRQSNLLQLTLRGTDPEQTAATLNAVTDEFIAQAARLKKANLVEFTRALEEQLRLTADALQQSESALEGFRANTITLPSENSPVAGGVEMTRDPVLDNYFTQKIEYDNVRQDREVLERLLADARGGRSEVGSAIAIPASVQSAEGLRATLDQLATKQAELRAARRFYTDEHQTVQSLQREVAELRDREVPARIEELLAQLRRREADLNARITAASRDIRAIPARTIEEARRRRTVEINENLYTSLQQRYEFAKLAEASALPDVSPLDSALPPQVPTSNSAPRIVLLAIAASVALGVLLALLLDHLDRRLRYPEQVTRELGLDIVGAVPKVSRHTSLSDNPEEAAQVVEAFRTIRLHLLNVHDSVGPLMVTISSPGAGEGKSLISSNLALSFAEAGYRTLLVDGDLRRGDLHTVMNVSRRPGLYDYLVGDSTLAEIQRASPLHDNVTLIPCGTRRHRAPELLASSRMNQLLADVQREFDVVLMDSPPLSAGIDPYALATATRNMLMVVRIGVTDRKLAAAKLQLVDKLPVRLVGAVLNDVQAAGAFEYYSYDYRYAPIEEDEVPRRVVGSRELTVRS